MCGLVGVAGNLQFQDEFLMKRLLLADFFRGEHSTGMAAIRTGGDAVIAKLASNPIDLFNTKQFAAALNGNASRAFMGHNRQATRGRVTTVNAHPFQFGHIIGMHNGTLDYESVRDLEEAIGEKFEVDSMAMIAGIAKLGIQDTIALCNEGKDSKEGAWALVWFDQNEKSLNFLRNKHRPLWYAYEQGFQRLFWASEWWMIREAIESSTNGYKLYTENEKDKKNVGYFHFDDDVHYKFDLAALQQGSKKRPKPIAKILRGREKKVVASTGNFTVEDWPRPTGSTMCGTRGGGAGSQSYPQKTGCGSTEKGLTTRRGTENKREVIQLSGINSPYAGMLDEDKFAMLYTKCLWCKTPVKYGDLGITVFERDGQCLCRDCSGYPEQHPSPPVRIYVRPNIFNAMA